MVQKILSQFPPEHIPLEMKRDLSAPDRKYGNYVFSDSIYDVREHDSPGSPVTAGRMFEMGPENTLNCIIGWVPTEDDRFNLINEDGLSNELSLLIEKHPFFFDKQMERLFDLEANYIGALLFGWQTAFENQDSIPHGTAIELCCHLCHMSEESVTDDEKVHSDHGSELRNAKATAAHFMRSLLSTERFEASSDDMRRLLDCLLVLASLPSEENEDMMELEDSEELALNDIRPIAISCLGEWLTRSEPDAEGSSSALEVLSSALPTNPISPTDLFALTEAISLLILSPHRSWVQTVYSQLFGDDEPNELQRVALSTILTWGVPNRDMFFFLLPAMKNALEVGIDSYPRCSYELSSLDTASNMGKWIYMAILRGDIDVTNALFLYWYSLADDENKSLTLGRCCSTLPYHTNSNSNAVSAMKALWDFHLAHKNDSYAPVCGALTLYGTGLFDSDWIEEALLQEAANPLFPDLFISDESEIMEIATANPAWSIRFLQQLLITNTRHDYYSYRRIAPKMLDLYTSSGSHEQDEAFALVKDQLVRLGVIAFD